MNINIRTDEDGGVILTDLDAEYERYFSPSNELMLEVLSFIFSKYSNEWERAMIIKEFVFKDKIAKYIFDKKEL